MAGWPRHLCAPGSIPNPSARTFWGVGGAKKIPEASTYPRSTPRPFPRILPRGALACSPPPQSWLLHPVIRAQTSSHLFPITVGGGGYSGFPAQASPCPHPTACWAGPHPRRLASAPRTGPKAWGAQRGPWKGFRLVHPTSQRAQQPDKTSLRRRVAAGAAPAPLAPRGGGIAAHTPTPLPTLDAVSSTSFFKQGHLFSSQGDRLLGMNLHVPMKAPADMNWAAKATLTWLRVSG